VLHLLVGIEHHAIERVIGQTDRQAHLQFTAACFVQDTTDQPRPQHMELRLADRVLKPQQQPIVVLAGVIQPVLVQDQRAAEGAQLEQAMPICR
jgi:hypothetical protein